MKKYAILCAVLSLTATTLLAQTANVQQRWRAEIRPEVNFPTQNLGSTSLNTGFGFVGTIAYHFLPHVAAYGGWSWNRFSAAKSVAGNDLDFVETGYQFGLQFIHPIAASKISYLLRTRGTYSHFEG